MSKQALINTSSIKLALAVIKADPDISCFTQDVGVLYEGSLTKFCFEYNCKCKDEKISEVVRENAEKENSCCMKVTSNSSINI